MRELERLCVRVYKILLHLLSSAFTFLSASSDRHMPENTFCLLCVHSNYSMCMCMTYSLFFSHVLAGSLPKSTTVEQHMLLFYYLSVTFTHLVQLVTIHKTVLNVRALFACFYSLCWMNECICVSVHSNCVKNIDCNKLTHVLLVLYSMFVFVYSAHHRSISHADWL